MYNQRHFSLSVMLLVYHAFLIFRKNQLPKGSEMQTEILVDNTNSEVDSL